MTSFATALASRAPVEDSATLRPLGVGKILHVRGDVHAKQAQLVAVGAWHPSCETTMYDAAHAASAAA
jgi:hypothetical protein